MDSSPFDDSPAGSDPTPNNVALLKRAWRNECTAPEILAYETDLVSAVMDQIRNLEEVISAFDDSRAEALEVQMYSVDVMRAKYLVRAYLKARHAKIENFTYEIMGTQDLYDRLSEAEKEYGNRGIEIYDQHLYDSVLSRLTPEYQDPLTEELSGAEADVDASNSKTIPRANLEGFVMVRTLTEMEGLQLDADGEETVDWVPNELYAIRYKPLRHLIEEHKVELI